MAYYAIEIGTSEIIIPMMRHHYEFAIIWTSLDGKYALMERHQMHFTTEYTNALTKCAKLNLNQETVYPMSLQAPIKGRWTVHTMKLLK